MESKIASKKLGEIGKVSMCKRILKKQTSDTGEIPFYKISTFGGKASVYIDNSTFVEYKNKYSFPKKGDVLISAAGTVGKTVVYDGKPAYFQDSNIVWIDNDEAHVLNSYLYYYYQLNPWRKSDGSTITRIYNDDLRSLDISYPINKRTQANISDILSCLDKKIALNLNINSELEHQCVTFFNYWFLQFDFPDKDLKPYKSSGGKMKYSEELKKEIPEDWDVYSISDLISKAKNGDWGSEKNDYNSIEVYCIRGADIEGVNGLESFDPPKRYIKKSHDDRILKQDDLVIEISGGSPVQSTGRISHISESVLKRVNHSAVCSNFCKAISLKDRRLSHIVNQYWTRLYESNVFFNHEGKTSGIKNLMFDQLAKDVFIAIPNDSNLIEKFHIFADKINETKQQNLIENDQLISIRDWLLPLLFSGQVVVKK